MHKMPSQASQETLRDVYEISWLGEMEKAVRFSGWEAGTLGRCKLRKFWCKENNEKKRPKRTGKRAVSVLCQQLRQSRRYEMI